MTLRLFMITNKITLSYAIAITYLIVISIWYYISIQVGSNFSLNEIKVKSFYFEPYASTWFQSFIIKHFQEFAFNFLIIVIIPFSIYLLLVKIYSGYISIVWSSLLALLSLSVFENLSFHDFLIQMGNIFSDSKPSNIVPLIFEFPLPNFSTLYFIATYYIITSVKKINLVHITVFSFLVAFDFYINAIDALFLIAFWLIYFPYKIYLNKQYTTLFVLMFSIGQAAIIFFAIFYGLRSGQINPDPSAIYFLPLYNILFYLVVPVIFMILLYFVQRIDLFEIVFKFRHIYAFMAVEIGVILLTFSGILPIDLHILKSRILQFFIHLFYYVPIIYYIGRPVYHYSIGSEAGIYSTLFRKTLYLIYTKGENLIAITLTMLLVIYNLFPIIILFNK